MEGLDLVIEAQSLLFTLKLREYASFRWAGERASVKKSVWKAGGRPRWAAREAGFCRISERRISTCEKQEPDDFQVEESGKSVHGKKGRWAVRGEKTGC